MPMKAYCCIPGKTKSRKKAKEGSCPSLLYDLFKELEGANEIHIAAYLFNNPVYFDFLSSLAEKGCKVNITSIPILGYNDKPLEVESFKEKISGRQMAQLIYNKIQESGNMNLEIFPHKYVWYGALYAGGGASYSFHVKAIYAKFQGKMNKCILSSGNFMFTDPFHSDNVIVFEGILAYERAYAKFFEDLEKFSIPYKNYHNKYRNYKDEFQYSLLGREIRLKKNVFKNCFFTAPFYIYGETGSNHYAGNRIIELINQAKKRVWVCAQHFHDLISFDTERETLIKALYDKFLANQNIKFRFLKQVPHSSLADKRRAGIAETLFKFVMKAEQRFNRLAHDKFIIIDNTLIVSTANYTSTQFAFGKRKMDFIDKDTKIRKEDNFSEVNAFAIIPSCPKKVLSLYEDHFKALWESGQNIEINL